MYLCVQCLQPVTATEFRDEQFSTVEQVTLHSWCVDPYLRGHDCRTQSPFCVVCEQWVHPESKVTVEEAHPSTDTESIYTLHRSCIAHWDLQPLLCICGFRLRPTCAMYRRCLQRLPECYECQSDTGTAYCDNCYSDHTE